MPLCIDLYCGLGGWAEGFLSESYEVIGYDIERHDYGTGGYPGTLVLQDVLTLHGSQFKDATCIVASPPCQAYSYRAMPWNPLWQENSEMDDDGAPPINHRIPDPIFNTLFHACFRIQREACEAAGRHIPMVVENVCGAQRWVGRAGWHFGSFYLWGDIPALMPMMKHRKGRIHGWTNGTHEPEGGQKIPGFRFDGSHKSFQSAAVERYKTIGMNWSDRTKHGQDFTRIAGKQVVDNGTKQGGDLFGKNCESSISRMYGSKSPARKAASAYIAKIPLPLASHIARAFRAEH